MGPLRIQEGTLHWNVSWQQVQEARPWPDSYADGRGWGGGGAGLLGMKSKRIFHYQSPNLGDPQPEPAGSPSTLQAPRLASWASGYLLEEAEGLLGGSGGQDGVAAPRAGSQGEGEAGHHLGLQLCDADLLLRHCQQCLPEHGLRQGGHHLQQSGVRVGESQESRTAPPDSPTREESATRRRVQRQSEGQGLTGAQMRGVG